MVYNSQIDHFWSIYIKKYSKKKQKKNYEFFCYEFNDVFLRTPKLEN
jgi:hypothetical protein